MVCPTHGAAMKTWTEYTVCDCLECQTHPSARRHRKIDWEVHYCPAVGCSHRVSTGRDSLSVPLPEELQAE